MSDITINEIHYDNVGGDSGEFIELKIPANTDLDNITISLYNGGNSAVYDTIEVGSGMAPDSGDGFAYLAVPVPGIQNGAPDGVAVDLNGNVCEFISYEGTITAIGGPADGMTSTDIGVSEAGTTAIGESLQVIDGTWSGPMPETPNQPNCFLEGTRIETKSGPVPIEQLKIGDEVHVFEGDPAKIIWIGRQTIDPLHIQDARYGHPVRIDKNAIAQNLPHTELYVSPGHGIYIDGLLINAGALVNNVSIKIMIQQQPFMYYHIELASHELILAEGLLTESYLAHSEKRSNYDNGQEYEEEHARETKILPWPMAYPRVTAASQVPHYVYDHLWIQATKMDLKSA